VGWRWLDVDSLYYRPSLTISHTSLVPLVVPCLAYSRNRRCCPLDSQLCPPKYIRKPIKTYRWGVVWSNRRDASADILAARSQRPLEKQSYSKRLEFHVGMYCVSRASYTWKRLSWDHFKLHNLSSIFCTFDEYFNFSSVQHTHTSKPTRKCAQVRIKIDLQGLTPSHPSSSRSICDTMNVPCWLSVSNTYPDGRETMSNTIKPSRKYWTNCKSRKKIPQHRKQGTHSICNLCSIYCVHRWFKVFFLFFFR
jgi:hypothetical protein